MFFLHVEILQHGYYRLTAGFCKHLHLDSSNYLSATVLWHSCYHRAISDYHRELHSDRSNDHLKLKLCRWIKTVCRWMNYVWSWIAMVIADSSMIMRMSRDGRAKVCQWIKVRKNSGEHHYIHDEEFQCVGRTIFI